MFTNEYISSPPVFIDNFSLAIIYLLFGKMQLKFWRGDTSLSGKNTTTTTNHRPIANNIKQSKWRKKMRGPLVSEEMAS